MQGAPVPFNLGKLLRVKLRGHLALLIIVSTFLVSDLVQRLVIAPTVKLFPSRRIPVLTAWQRLMATVVLGPVRVIGGAKFQALPRIPGESGVLILMNHQSVLDIPLVVRMVRGRYPRIVTRQRYASRIPLISHMIRLYQYPTVDPGANPGKMRSSLEKVADAARAADVPLVIYPEGTRSRNGAIGRFRGAGLKTILATRPWRVYVVVADGFWERAKLKDLMRGMAQIDGRAAVVGPFEWQDPEADSDPFIERMHACMTEELYKLRTGGPNSADHSGRAA